jgi:hypothetical protein
MGKMCQQNLIKSVSLAVVLVMAAGSTKVFADDSVVQGLQAEYNTEQSIVTQMGTGDLHGITKIALEVVVYEGIKNLRAVGEITLADQFQTEWDNEISGSIDNPTPAGGISALDIGDHDPLSPWLANFYQVLLQKTMGLAKAFQLANDINTLNYALGVVLHPNGSWRANTSYDRIEYRKHFIPFANLVTYYATLESCKHFLPKVSMVCSYGADYLEKYMGRHIAPVLSDKVFQLATEHHSVSDYSTQEDSTLNEQDFINTILNEVQPN